MNSDKIIEYLKNKLIPKFYISFESVEAKNFFAVFKSKDLIISRYLLALSYIQPGFSLIDQIELIRSEIKSKYRAFWFFREIGLHIIFISNSSDVVKQFEDVKPDKFGNHAVIFQGVHLVNIESNTVFASHSSWGDIKFGKGKNIDHILKEAIKNN